LDELDAAMTRMVRAEHGESAEDDRAEDDDLPGLYYPLHYAVQTWVNFKEHGILPEAGGWNDQDWRLVECDWIVIGNRYARANRHLYPLEGQKSGGNGIQVPKPGTAGDWRDILK
jgi:hypothetical protein